MRLPHRLQGQKSRSRGGGILWQLVNIIIIVIIIIIFTTSRYIHRDLTDGLDLTVIINDFISVNDFYYYLLTFVVFVFTISACCKQRIASSGPVLLLTVC